MRVLVMRQRRWISRTVVPVTVLAVIFGPQWCCCTLKSFAARPAAAAGERGTCCCCEIPVTSASSCPRNDGGHDDGAPCPCRGKPRMVAVGNVVADAELDRGSGAWEGVPAVCWPGNAPTSLGAASVRSSSGVGTPALSGRALLRALSILRC